MLRTKWRAALIAVLALTVSSVCLAANDLGVTSIGTKGIKVGAGGLQLTTDAVDPTDGGLASGRLSVKANVLRFYNGSSWANVATGTSGITADNIYDSGAWTVAVDANDVIYTLATGYNMLINSAATGTQAVALEINDNTGGTITDGVLFTATNSIVDAVDASATNIDNAINVGANVIKGGLASIDFTEFDVSAGTGAVTIDDGGNAGSITIESTVLDIDSLDFVGAGAVTAAASSALTLDPNSGNAAGEDLIVTAHNVQLTAAGKLTMSPDAAETLAVDLTDTDYTNAISLGDNAILGTTGVINYTNFDVDAAGAVVCTALDAGAGTIQTTGDLTASGTVTLGTLAISAVQPSSGNLTINGATGASTITIGSLSTAGITVSDDVTFGVTSLFSGATGLGFRAAANNVASSGVGQLDVDATTEVEIATGTLDANLSAALAIDAVTASNISVTTGDITIEATDSGNAGTYDVIIEAGNVAPTAAEDGNDIALEAEDDVLVESTDDVDMDVGGDLLVDAGATISLDAAAGASNFTTTGGDLTLESTDASVNINATEAAADQIKLNAAGTHTGFVINLTTTNGQIGIDANNAGNGDIILNSEDDTTLDATGLISLDAGAASNVTTSAGDLTLEASAASVNINANEAAADQIKLNAQGTNAGFAINLTTTDGQIGIDANNAANGDVIINSEDDTTIDATGLISLDAGAASNFTTSAGSITIDSATDIILSATGADIDVSVADLSVDSLKKVCFNGIAAKTNDFIYHDGTDVVVDATADIKLNGAVSVDVGAAFSVAGLATFTGGQTRKVWLGIGGVAADTAASSIVLDSAVPPSEGVTGTSTVAEFACLKFDANPNATGDDYVFIHWKVPDGYKADSLRLNIHFIGPVGEVATDDIAFDGTVNAVGSGEALDIAGTGMTLVTDEQTTAVGGEYFIAQLNCAVETIAVDDLVTIAFFVDESACELAIAGTVDIIGFEIEYESTE